MMRILGVIIIITIILLLTKAFCIVCNISDYEKRTGLDAKLLAKSFVVGKLANILFDLHLYRIADTMFTKSIECFMESNIPEKYKDIVENDPDLSVMAEDYLDYKEKEKMR